MDLNKLKKPFHIICPNCGNEVEIWANDVERKYQKSKQEITDINLQLSNFRKSHPKSYKNDIWYKKLSKVYEYKLQEIAEIKKVRKMLQDEAERQKDRAFKDVVKIKVGNDTFMKWIKEAEDDIQYHTYDNAKQKSSPILGKPYDK